jgi:hypothetical protein
VYWHCLVPVFDAIWTRQVWLAVTPSGVDAGLSGGARRALPINAAETLATLATHGHSRSAVHGQRADPGGWPVYQLFPGGALGGGGR